MPVPPGSDPAKELKGARYALWRNPEDLTQRQAAKLADIAATNRPLYRAYLLKEQLRQVFQLGGQAGIELLDRWFAWAQRSRIEAFVNFGRSIRRHRTAINETLTTGTTNALVESTNTRLRVIHRRDYGFRTSWTSPPTTGRLNNPRIHHKTRD
jgi:transposase